ncbi:hypothetical protein JZ751_011381 [Albula glossodonta]|uniref:Uncharacterized protein n=1 Tax=Albula glossodonta TaxID=121402 RepID=A0A8T2MZF6_9TELE|nr:hypothetical protein JZ751_011381 [Albula glossodonta]
MTKKCQCSVIWPACSDYRRGGAAYITMRYIFFGPIIWQLTRSSTNGKGARGRMLEFKIGGDRLVVQDVAGIHVDQKETEDAEAKTLLEEEETQKNTADSSREESKDLPGVPDFRDADNAWEGES